MSEETTEAIREELPDAFARWPGDAIAKVRAFVQHVTLQIQELDEAKRSLPDSLNRPMAERIRLLAERADREAKIAVHFRTKWEAERGSDPTP